MKTIIEEVKKTNRLLQAILGYLVKYHTPLNKKSARDSTKKEIISGYVLEANESEEAREKSYDDMNIIGLIRIADEIEEIEEKLSLKKPILTNNRKIK